MWLEKMLMKKIKYTISYFVIARIFVIPFYYGSGI